MNEKAMVINPFNKNSQVTTQSAESGGALTSVEQSRAVAETQAAMVIAKRFPRNQIESMDRILNACTRPSLAESALYTYARGGTNITGPSIRLAEAIAQSWGNLQFGIRELEQKDGSSTVEAYAWDIESNTRQVKVFQVKHFRHTKRGGYDLTDPRDIYEMTANQGARRLRACILGIIPGDVVESAVKQCEETMKTSFEITPEYLNSMVENFEKHGVSKKQIEKRIQRRIDAITPALVISLKKIYNSMKDGMSVPGDWFDVEESGDTVNDLKTKAAADKKDKAAKKKPEPTVEPPAPVKTYDEIKADDPNGLKAAIVEAGFETEKDAEQNDQCKAKVAEAYDFMN